MFSAETFDRDPAVCPDVSSTTYDRPWRDPRYRTTLSYNVPAAWSFFFFCFCDQRRMRPSRPVVCFAFAATEKVVIVLRIPRLRQGPYVLQTQPRGAQLKAQTCGPRKVQVGGSRCVPKERGFCGLASHDLLWTHLQVAESLEG